MIPAEIRAAHIRQLKQHPTAVIEKMIAGCRARVKDGTDPQAAERLALYENELLRRKQPIAHAVLNIGPL